MKKSLIIFFVILVLTPLFFIPITANAVGDAWLEGWSYRKSHEIANATGSGTNYQVKILVINGIGSDSGNTVYINNKMESDFSDMRFTYDGNKTLDYWAKEVNNGDNATFWVEVADDLSVANQTIYMYYGNNTVSTTSSGTDTWINFEDNEGSGDFEWVMGGNTADGSTSLVSAVPPYGGSQSREVKIDGSSSYYAIWVVAEMNTMSASNRIGYWIRKAYGSSRTETLMNFGEPNVLKENLNNLPVSMTDGAGAGFDSTAFDNFAFTTGTYFSTVTSTTVDEWYFVEILVESTTLASYYYYDSNEVLLESEIDASMHGFDTAEQSVYLYSGTTYPETNYHSLAWFDTLYVGKYVSPEPVHGSWGEEENIVPIFITFYNQTNSVFMMNGTIMSNGTTTNYLNKTVLSLQGIINVSTQFIEWNMTTGNAYINPYNYMITANTTIWLIISGVSGGNGDGETLFLFGSVNAIPMNLLYYIALTMIGLTLLLKSQFLGKLLSALLFAFQAIWISGDILLDTQINYISAYNTTSGVYQYVNTVTHINTPILSFLIILSIGLALKGAIDTFSAYNKRKG